MVSSQQFAVFSSFPLLLLLDEAVVMMYIFHAALVEVYSTAVPSKTTYAQYPLQLMDFYIQSFLVPDAIRL